MAQAYALQTAPQSFICDVAFSLEPRYFYVDNSAGNDANTGRTPNEACQTITKMNNYTSFRDLNYVCFQRGDSWVGTMLSASRGYLVFEDYGTGAKPVIDGNDAVDCVRTNGYDYLTFRNLDITQGLDFGINVDNSEYITIDECDCHDCGNDNLIFSNSAYCSVLGGTFYNAYVRVLDDRHISGIEIMDGAHDIIIDGAEWLQLQQVYS